jgi:plastocyanin
MSVTWNKTFLVVALAALWSSGACGGKSAALSGDPGISANFEDPEVEIIATEFAFEPNEIEVKPYQTLTLQLRNEGELSHSIAFKLPDREITAARILGPQESVQMSFTVPATPGEYTFYCPVGDHRERGMVGKLIVR